MASRKLRVGTAIKGYDQSRLTDPNYVCEYINSALAAIDSEQNKPEDILATMIACLRDIIDAHGGINQFAKKIPELHRTTLYGIFSEKDKRKNGPEFLTVLRIMKVCGVSLKAA